MGEPAEKGGSSSDGDGFSGIDPERLAKTIQSLDKDQSKIMTSVGWIKSSFERYGVGVEPLTELKSIAGWANEQLPMLRRRHHLSIAEDEKYGHGYKGMVKIQESMVGQTKQSLKDGKELGKKFKEGLNDGDDPTPEMYADLRAHKGDADYVKAFYDELGPQRVGWLSTVMGDRNNDRYKDHPDEREKDRSVIADTFGTYTKVAFEGKSAKAKQQAWNKWFSDSSLDEYEGFRPDRLTPFLKGGSHDKDFLVAFSDRVLDKKKQGKTDELRFFGNNQTGEGEWGKDNYQQLFDAVSENPAAAGEAMDHNYDFVQHSLYPTGPWKVDEPKERGKAFFNMVNAATVTLKQTNPSLAEKNTARILFDNYQNRKGKDGLGHPIEGTQALYASILTAYWKDLEHGVTSPAGNTLWGSDIKAKGEEKYATTTKWSLQDYMKGQDSGRSGLEASDGLWRALMEESARDPKAAGTLSALFQRYDEKALDHAYSTEKSSEHAGAFDSMKRGMMQEFYQESMKTASGEIEGDIDKWVTDTNNFRAKIIDTAGDVALGATGGAGLAGAKGAAVGVAWGLGSGVATGLLKDLVKADPDDAPKGLKEAFKGVKENTADFSWQTDYQNNADAAREHDKIEPVTIESDGKDGSPKGIKEYTGDVKDYAKGDGNFLNKKGEIKDIGDMSTAERTAYNKWLQDPAVVAAIWPEYSRGRNARDYPGQDS
ncbi:hypothetical protein OG453_00860 [Streptomyces sp. NBC_01381]|uniref:hypothetical protein n=1 Tax=Streptomyces sp. NBC_01381 TaxID=2903845 RepID=UPI00225B78B3|nr:hypothetical protein [Streptomyces sp. NBC_01381]MCX4665236.1 hypothetical protein [Streptomyces sp. NBC_01381]